jgi:hypothetical protein
MMYAYKLLYEKVQRLEVPDTSGIMSFLTT